LPRQQTGCVVYATIFQSPNALFGDALKGGIEVGSRVRIAAATCFVASGLFVGGIGGALAFAEPSHDTVKADDDGARAPSNSKTDNKNPDRNGQRDQKSGDQKPDDGKPDDQKLDDPKPGDDDGGSSPTSPAPTRTSDKPTPTSDKPIPTSDKPTPTSEKPTPTPTPTPTSDVPTPTEEPDPECDDKGKDDCGAGIPWWPFPWPWDPSEPGDPGPGGGSGSGGGGGGAIPAGIPHVPSIVLPGQQFPQTEPAEPVEPINAVAGAAAGELPLQPITLPVILAPPPMLAAAGAPRSVPESLPGSARGAQTEPPAGRRPSEADIGSNVNVPPASYRAGYTDYLRTAGISQVVAMAGPGVAGILVLTGAGGLFGYRQAKAGHAVRTGRTARFVN
jgi:hypothetical protein